MEKEGLNRRHFSAVSKRCVSCLHHKLLSSQMKVLRRIVLLNTGKELLVFKDNRYSSAFLVSGCLNEIFGKMSL